MNYGASSEFPRDSYHKVELLSTIGTQVIIINEDGACIANAGNAKGANAAVDSGQLRFEIDSVFANGRVDCVEPKEFVLVGDEAEAYVANVSKIDEESNLRELTKCVEAQAVARMIASRSYAPDVEQEAVSSVLRKICILHSSDSNEDFSLAVTIMDVHHGPELRIVVRDTLRAYLHDLAGFMRSPCGSVVSILAENSRSADETALVAEIRVLNEVLAAGQTDDNSGIVN